jgi:peptidoglycan-associated lipoprotein
MNWKHLAISFASASLLVACASPKAPEQAATQPVAPVVDNSANISGASQTAVDPLRDPNSPLAKRSVYFDYDSSVVKGEYQPTTEAHAGYLKDHATRKVQIQGNTDARGSREYNLALGQRRSEAVKKSLEVLGVKSAQIEATSYGKEKPKATGTSETDYAENRRADIAYDGE